MTGRQLLPWVALAVLTIVAFSIGGRRGLAQRRSAIEMQEATTPLQPATQPALVASAAQLHGFSPSGSNVDLSGSYA